MRVLTSALIPTGSLVHVVCMILIRGLTSALPWTGLVTHMSPGLTTAHTSQMWSDRARLDTRAGSDLCAHRMNADLWRYLLDSGNTPRGASHLLQDLRHQSFAFIANW